MRLADRLLAVAAALALFAGGLLVGAEIVLARLGREPWVIPHDRWRAEALDTTWASTSARLLFLALAAGGLVLVVLQLVRRRPATLTLEADQAARPAQLSRRSLERSLARTVERIDGVAGAKARLSRKRVRVRATTNRRLVGDLETRVTQAAERHLRGLALATTPPVTANVRQRGRR